MENPAAATTMVREIDNWLTSRAQGGSATAQFWMAERAGLAWTCTGIEPDPAESAKWYRTSAEQDFAPAQDALGQLLMVYEFHREPFEAEKWFLRAARQGEIEAVKHLLWAIDVDTFRPGYKPSADILLWLQQQADTGDEKAKRLLARLAPKN